MIRYLWPRFSLTFDPATGFTETAYPDGKTSGVGVLEDDRMHANALGVTPEYHRLQHELGHHLIGTHFYRSAVGSPVLWRDAHGIGQTAGGYAKPGWSEAEREEWLVNFLQYASLSETAPHSDGALEMLMNAGIDVASLCADLATLVDVASFGAVDVTFPAPAPARGESPIR